MRITSGCDPDRFCPDDSVTRAQMASFLARALGLPAAADDWFTDDDTSTHEANINRIAEAGVTLGCDSGVYCPDDPVERAQMASFLARALALEPSTADRFSDDDGSTHEANIDALADAAITQGCSTPGWFCPTDQVTRGQMAAFLYRALAG
jgi:hypothetical protein